MSRSARLFALLLALLCWVVLVTHVRLGLARAPEASLLQELWRTGRYFTILTNGLTAVTMAAVALGWRVPAVWAAGLTLWMAIVGIVYHALLALDFDGLRWWTDQGLHTAVPIALFLWWLAFAPRAGLAWRHALWWIGWPGLYMLYALIRGEIDGRHPYFFIDPPKIGWGPVLLWIVALGVVFWLAGLVLVALAKSLSRDRPRPEDAVPDGLPPR